MNAAQIASLSLACAYALDLLFGDPERMPHPVRAFGRIIDRAERNGNRSVLSDARRRRNGTALAVLLPAGTFTVAVFVLWSCAMVSSILSIAAETVLLYFCLAVKALRQEAERVRRAVEAQNVEMARSAVSRIVGRDTDKLDLSHVTAACTETIAESTADGVGAPLFWAAFGGAPLALTYKAVNTLDSMVGYKSSRFREFGRSSARQDDVWNCLPSRWTAVSMIAASFLLRLDGRNAWRIWRRDRRCHASPNSAQTEAAMAGALGVRLGGPSRYEGILVEKPFIGDHLSDMDARTIQEAERLSYLTSLIMAVQAVAVRYLILSIAGGFL